MPSKRRTPSNGKAAGEKAADDSAMRRRIAELVRKNADLKAKCVEFEERAIAAESELATRRRIDNLPLSVLESILKSAERAIARLASKSPKKQ